MKTALLLLLTILAGCQSTQLTHTTLDTADTLEELQVQLVLDNVRRVWENPYCVPQMMRFTTGNITINDSVTPTLLVPLPLNQWWTKGGVNVGANLGWTQAWTVVPVTDPVDLENLADIYRLALYGTESPSVLAKAPSGKSTFTGLEATQPQTPIDPEVRQGDIANRVQQRARGYSLQFDDATKADRQKADEFNAKQTGTSQHLKSFPEDTSSKPPTMMHLSLLTINCTPPKEDKNKPTLDAPNLFQLFSTERPSADQVFRTIDTARGPLYVYAERQPDFFKFVMLCTATTEETANLVKQAVTLTPLRALQ